MLGTRWTAAKRVAAAARILLLPLLLETLLQLLLLLLLQYLVYMQRKCSSKLSALEEIP